MALAASASVTTSQELKLPRPVYVFLVCATVVEVVQVVDTTDAGLVGTDALVVDVALDDLDDELHAASTTMSELPTAIPTAPRRTAGSVRLGAGHRPGVRSRRRARTCSQRRLLIRSQ